MINKHESPLSKGRDPADVEAEVVQLRSDCAKVIRELESRYESAVRVPREIGAATVRVEKAVRRSVSVHPAAWIAGAATLGLGAALIGWQLRERRRLSMLEESALCRFKRTLRAWLG